MNRPMHCSSPKSFSFDRRTSTFALSAGSPAAAANSRAHGGRSHRRPPPVGPGRTAAAPTPRRLPTTAGPSPPRWVTPAAAPRHPRDFLLSDRQPSHDACSSALASFSASSLARQRSRSASAQAAAVQASPAEPATCGLRAAPLPAEADRTGGLPVTFVIDCRIGRCVLIVFVLIVVWRWSLMPGSHQDSAASSFSREISECR
jgi:hypothetical protein